MRNGLMVQRTRSFHHRPVLKDSSEQIVELRQVTGCLDKRVGAKRVEFLDLVRFDRASQDDGGNHPILGMLLHPLQNFCCVHGWHIQRHDDVVREPAEFPLFLRERAFHVINQFFAVTQIDDGVRNPEPRKTALEQDDVVFVVGDENCQLFAHSNKSRTPEEYNQ